VKIAMLLLALVAFEGTAHAEAPRTSVPAKADVVVEVELGELDLEVAGWVREKVEVDEDVGARWTARLEEDGGRVRVRFDGPPGIPTKGTVRLRLPKSAELQVSSRNGSVRAVDFAGRATIAAIAGDISVSGPAKQLEVATTSGAIEIAGADGRVDVATISGGVQAAGIAGDLHIESVSGRVEIANGKLDRLELDTVSGDIEVGAELRKGPHRIDTSSGSVTLTLPRTTALRIVIASFSGTIVDRFDQPATRTRGKHQRELGKGGGLLEVASFSGDIALAPRS
jgi:hypothetical protein